MNSLVHFLNQCSPAWWEYTLHATWQAALTAAILLGVAALGRKWPAPWRYGLLLVALLKFAVPPFLSVPFGAFSHLGPRMAASAPLNPAQPSTVVARDSDFALGAPAQAAPGPGLSLARPLAWSGFAAHTAKTPVRAGDPPGPRLHRTAWLMLLHLAGFAAMLAWVARQLSRLRGAVRLSRPMAEGPLHLMLSLPGRRVENQANSRAKSLGPACGPRCLRSPSPDCAHAGDEPVAAFGTGTEGHPGP